MTAARKASWHSPRSLTRILSATVVVANLSLVPGASALASSPAASCGNWNVIEAGVNLFAVAAVSANDAWAVGIDATFQTLIKHWDGKAWSVVPSPNPGTNFNHLFGVAALSATDAWAVGRTANSDPLDRWPKGLMERWDGTQWSALPPVGIGDEGTSFNSVAAVSVNDVWAVGGFLSSDGVSGPFVGTAVAHWNGASWDYVNSGPTIPFSGRNGFSGVSAVSSSDVWAVGSGGGSGQQQTLVGHWDGTRWDLVPSPNVGDSANVLNGIAAVSANDIWAVGFSANSTSPTRTLVEHWDGTSWSVVPSPNVGDSANLLFGVAAVSANDVWAVGYNVTSSGTTAGLIQHWDGTSWSVVPNPGTGALFGTAASSANDVWAVGNLIEHCQLSLGAPTADLLLSKSASPGPVRIGTDLTYSLNTTNNGPDPAVGVVLTDTLPDGTTFISSNVSPSAQGSCSGTLTVTCNLGSMPRGASAVVTIVVTAPTTPGVISNSATIDSSTTDPTRDNNSSRVTTEIFANIYAALGDSVAAGVGLSTVLPCERFPLAYPGLVAQAKAHTYLGDFACAGASITNGVLTPQVFDDGSSLASSQIDQAEAIRPDKVSLTIGIDDLHWVDIITDCYEALKGCAFRASVPGTPEATFSANLDAFTANLTDLVRTIKGWSPSPDIVLTNYYWLFPEKYPPSGSCFEIDGAGIRFFGSISRNEFYYLRSLENRLNIAIATVVSQARRAYGNVSLANIRQAFIGHDVCASNPWIFHLSIEPPIVHLQPQDSSFHPNDIGQQEVARVVSGLW